MAFLSELPLYSLESLILLFGVGLSPGNEGLNHHKIVLPLFGAAYVALNGKYLCGAI